jgi:hypothetical protein
LLALIGSHPQVPKFDSRQTVPAIGDCCKEITVRAAPGPLFGIGRALYFCIPRNDKLLGYWDTVADRLFKIRH